MRGKPKQDRATVNKARITPADAGKTPLLLPCSLLFQDHPRGCGENRDGPAGICLNIGSPPRMRGKQHLTLSEECCIRITPADAGKTIIYHRMHSKSRDHPRGCGENLYFSSVSAQNSGSPPRMRGKLFISIIEVFCSGITPADAGKTFAVIF